MCRKVTRTCIDDLLPSLPHALNGAIDILACTCGGRLPFIATIDDPPVVARILRHLGLPTETPAPAPARPPPRERELSFNFPS